MNKADLKELTDSIVDLYITLRIRPQDEVSQYSLSLHPQIQDISEEELEAERDQLS